MRPGLRNRPAPTGPPRSRPPTIATAPPGWESLTEQELHIARLVGRALTNQQIATASAAPGTR